MQMRIEPDQNANDGRPSIQGPTGNGEPNLKKGAKTLDLKWPAHKFRTIYADPPWHEQGGGRLKRGADRHYPLMKTKEIMALPVGDLIHPDGAHLYLWVTNNYLTDGLRVLDAWGFRYVTMITWLKGNGHKIQRGIGQYFRGSTEHCLFGVSVKRTPPYRRLKGRRQQGQTAIIAERTDHSRKPVEMRDMIETVSYPPRIELFARTACEGWTVWGNEVP